VYEGSNYTLSGSTVTPTLNFTGVLSVPVTVNDGKHTSEKYNVQIQVYPINDGPAITGQTTLQTTQNNPVTLLLSHFTVSDPDNTYPTGFSLTVYAGQNYSVSGNTVSPATDFVGTLNVPVTVSDGSACSPTFTAVITVDPGNVRPVITGQTTLTTGINLPITILLSHLTVSDPDNTYPNDFTLSLSAGANYTVSGAVVTPAQGFVGTLSVSTVVNDGTSNSHPFTLKIEVLDGVQITGQVPLEINEDETITLELSQLQVNDPDKVFPQGYSLNVSLGENYTAINRKVIPATNYNGVLNVGVSVSNGKTTSNVFSLQITVVSVNDPPEIFALERDVLTYPIGNEAMLLSKELDILDVDDDHLLLAEVGFRPDTYRSGHDELLFTNTASIQGVFDETTGILSLVGSATLAEYRDALRSIQYYYSDGGDPRPEIKTIYIKLNDGETVSPFYEREINLTEDLRLDIPNGFTPNNDLANDTWKITPIKYYEWFDHVTVRVYNKRGTLVYETVGFEHAWDGRMNGELLPADTYYYTIDMNLTHIKTNYKGIVTILR
jgi:gliding motility-associated-like protein